MINKTIHFVIGGMIILLGAGCHYDKADLVYPSDGNCDTSHVISYSKEIVPIFSENCYHCHGGDAANGAGIMLDQYDWVYTMAVDLGQLVPAIKHEPGVVPMPQDIYPQKIPDCDISKIEAWVNQGAPNN